MMRPIIALTLLAVVGLAAEQKEPKEPKVSYSDVVGTLAGAIATSSKESQKQLDEGLQRMSQKPQSLLNGGEGAEALAALVASKSGANSISFQRTQGFSGLDEFEPSGWQLEVGQKESSPHPSGEKEAPAMWPAGVGMALMNGCFGRNYAPGDPCYSFARPAPTCPNLIDASAFIGVGFDGRGYYSADSRKMSIVQRVCKNKAKFMNADLPDTMNAFGLWDYSIDTNTFQDAKQYTRYLQEKAATSETESMFQMEAMSQQQASSSGGNFGAIGALAGAALGAYAGGAQGAQMGAQLGSALGQSIGFDIGGGSGSSSMDKEGSYSASRESSQSASQGSGRSTNMIAILEADLKLYEITLDEVKYSDMSTFFLTDFMTLPESFSDIGADTAIQSFILKWGTHYIRSAKFGGELRIMKTSTHNSKLSQEQFAETTQDEFAGMMGTLRSSFKQKESGWSFLGFGSKKRSSSQSSKLTNEQGSSASRTSGSQGQRNLERSSFIKTSIRVMGGNPTVGAAITDFYTPRFRETFVKWLDSIADFVRPYEFTLGKVSSLLSSSRDMLFPNGDASTGGCFGKNVKKDVDGRLYFTRTVMEKDAQNKSVEEKIRHYCQYKNSNELRDLIKRKKIALERGESIYMTEGPYSTSNFDIEAGRAGCEFDALQYISGNEKLMQTWPSWDKLMNSEFKVIFSMRQNLGNIGKNSEYYVKFYNGKWYTRTSTSAYDQVNACQGIAQVHNSRKFCAAGYPLVYFPSDGTFGLDIDAYLKGNITVPLWLRHTLGSVESIEGNIDLGASQLGKGGLVPCKLKWSNAHRMMLTNGNNDKAPTCLYFQAATEGSMHIVFAGLPDNYRTWYSMRLSKGSIAFFEAMKLRKIDTSIEKGILGSKHIFDAYFICLNKVNNKLVIEYGKSPPDVELGLIYSSYKFSQDIVFDRLFYAFGSGESLVSITDLRVIKEVKPRKCLEKGASQVNGVCSLQCDNQCNGCHKSNDPKSCNQCKNFGVQLSETIHCVANCPQSFVKRGKTCSCSAGSATSEKNGQYVCTKCPAGTKSDGLRCVDCPENTMATIGSRTCTPCPKGQSSPRRSAKCAFKCSGNPCQNGGTCADGANGYVCDCPIGYRGGNCQTKTCSHPCQHGGRCIENIPSPKCSCTGRNEGNNCEKQILPVIWNGEAGPTELYFWNELDHKTYRPAMAFGRQPGVFLWKFGSNPIGIHFAFNRPTTITEIGFSSPGYWPYRPKHFRVDGSNDCGRWVTLYENRNAGFTSANQFKTWKFPVNQRKKFRCIGIKFWRNAEEHIILENIQMWELMDPGVTQASYPQVPAAIWKVREGINFNGNDIKCEPKNDNACKNACVSNLRCVAATMFDHNGGRHCCLKHSLGGKGPLGGRHLRTEILIRKPSN